MTPPPSAARSLTSARIVLDHPGTLPTSSWTRAVAVLGRRALETAVDDYWRATQPDMARVRSKRAQFVCLRTYLDPAVASEAYETWSELSGACHHQVVEVAPTDVELRSWLESVGRFVAAVGSAT